MARVRRLLAPIGVLALAGLLSPHLPPGPTSVWLAVFGVAFLLDFAVAELFVRKAHAEKREREAAWASALTQMLMSLTVASFGLWAWTPDNDQTNCLILATLVLLCLTTTVPRLEGQLANAVSSAPLFAMLILSPWIGGSRIAAELTILTLGSLAYLIGQSIKMRQDASAIAALTEQKRGAETKLLAAQTALARLKNDADAAQATRRRLLAGLDADARAPLASMIQLTEALKEDTPSSGSEGRIKQHAAEIHGYCLQLQDFAEDIADLGRIESGSLTLETTCIDLQRLLSAIARDYAARLGDSQTSLDVVTFPDLPSLLADERLVRRMVMSLVASAIRETPPGGRVAITALRLPDGGLALRVSSTGAGLSEADLERVYDSLVSGRPERLSGDQQDGLGVMIVKAFAERHGGSLSIRTRLGAGTQATLNFPPERLISKRPLMRLTDAA